MGRVQIEICCGSALDALEAQKAGCDRVELCSALALGGLTPSLGQVKVAQAAGVSVMAMLRPRESGFCYTETEFQTILADASAFVEAGVDGIVFGFLREDGRVDTARCQAILAVAGGRETVFHRAIDVTPNWKSAMDEIMALGITRILTSGQAPNVLDGADTVRQMREYAAGRIQILPGAGIRPHNAAEVLARTGCNQLHFSLKKTCRDLSTSANPDIHFGGALPQEEACYSVSDRASIAQVIQALNDRG